MRKNKQRQGYEPEHGPAAAALRHVADHECIEPWHKPARIDTQLGIDYRQLRRIAQPQFQVSP